MTECQNCKEHKGTVDWVGSGSYLAISHGWVSKWCKCCALKAQIKYAEERMKALAELKKELKDVVCV